MKRRRPRIVQTLGCLLKTPQSEGLDRKAGTFATARGHTENGTVMAAQMKQHVWASFQQSLYILLVNYKIFKD